MLKSLVFLFFISLVSLPTISNAQSPEKNLKKMGITLKNPEPFKGSIVKAVRTGNLVFLSGHGPVKPEGGMVTGKLGTELTVTEGRAAAKLVGIDLLTSLKAEIGDLSKVKKIVKVLGMVNASPEFDEQPQVMNGFSDFMVEVFGEKGRHARSAVGMGSLPGNIALEIEMIVEIED
ncbi:RidA family protein [Cyclobacterium marinum]|uniref:Endoribonuclease L-PSP n=1 Tax=Cyclobacterium marinum (strain ATCC 25205 / DSM 745 / LMG 13164 / NCIMB 1802) TaxID=880070 RepID=G0J143_CYCMS|nr:RidA family protein [Cyclobacterium marinum]AEL25792.1 Endoribonuclease L-PSP [Cyclobacterium marinum DSM 745]MBI0401224.1 RidA family protein [Cyclobacterium marinum]MBR9777256.1 RidA family protein [Cytophagales bacterium]